MVRKTLNNLRCLFREILSLCRKEGQQLILLQVPLTVFWIFIFQKVSAMGPC